MKFVSVKTYSNDKTRKYKVNLCMGKKEIKILGTQ